MICSSCQHYNRDGLDFCTNCGTGLQSNKCANGHTIPAGVSECPYCPSAGRKKTVQEVGLPNVPGGGGSGPRKTVLVGETEIQQQLSNAPSVARSAAPESRSSKTVYRPAGDDSASPVATALKAVASLPTGGMVSSSGASRLIGFLVSYSSDSNGVFWPVRYGRVRVGSDAGLADVHLNHSEVSGDHMVINSRDSKGKTRIWCTDSNSVNGTSLNGEDIFNDRPDLKHGDVIGVGPVELVLVLVDP